MLTTTTTTTTTIPVVVEVVQDTPAETVASVVDGVASKAEQWKTLSISEKIKLLKMVLQNANELHEEWVHVACLARNISIDPKNIQKHGCGVADVEIGGPAMFGSYCNGLLKTLQAIENNKYNGKPPPPRKIRTINVISKDDQQQKQNSSYCAITLYPDGSLLDFLETVGLQGELIVKGSSPTQLSYYQDAVVGGGGGGGAGVAGILGAGNYDVPCDLLTQMFIKGRVCIYKPNPVAQATSPILQKIFAPLIQSGYLSFIIGGAAVGTALVQQHSKLDEIVMTGSPSTLLKIQQSILDDENNNDDKSATKTTTTTPTTTICSELGAVNPWIVVPGKHWNNRSINGHARSLAWAKLVNNGHVCASPQVILLPEEWEWRQQFMDRLRYWLRYYDGSPPFYPGSHQTHSHFANLPNAETLISSQRTTSSFDNQQNPVLLTNVGGRDDEKNLANTEVLTREAFCPVLAEVPIDASSCGEDPIAFLETAVKYAETKLFGSLSAVILMDDKTAKQPKVEEIVATMKFGIVGINMVPAFAYSLPQLVWGAFPGQTESGSGFLGNCGLYEQPQKTVLRAPFTWIGRRLVSVTSSRRTGLVFRRLATYKLRPNLWTQTKLFSALFLGI